MQSQRRWRLGVVHVLKQSVDSKSHGRQVRYYYYSSSGSALILCRLTSPGLIPGPTNWFSVTSATASASSPSFTGTLFRTNSTALSSSASYARKFRTTRGFPSESKVVTRTFHPAGILRTLRRNRRWSTPCLLPADWPSPVLRYVGW